jgi:hypothetical protein
VRLRLCWASRDSLSTSFSSSTLKPLLPGHTSRTCSHVCQTAAWHARSAATAHYLLRICCCLVASLTACSAPMWLWAGPADGCCVRTCHIQWSVLGQLLDDLLHHVTVLAANIAGVQLNMIVAAQQDTSQHTSSC